ncbi:uncharacterized protein LOC122388229 [Amphibalanus amphitrite]|uniref:uncharacterized protein LOC122388229 n=1 Tax=Amphibalanus amphitrite TaxID=1232801 RepID=UPI001C9255C8|nr:uncharacterized protein LOC122388229 [Amphibalanus amphitrite]
MNPSTEIAPPTSAEPEVVGDFNVKFVRPTAKSPAPDYEVPDWIFSPERAPPTPYYDCFVMEGYLAAERSRYNTAYLAMAAPRERAREATALVRRTAVIIRWLETRLAYLPTHERAAMRRLCRAIVSYSVAVRNKPCIIF